MAASESLHRSVVAAAGPAGAVTRTRKPFLAPRTGRGHQAAEPGGGGARPSHHAADGTFVNPWGSYIDRSPMDFFTKALPELRRIDAYPLPVVPPEWPAIHSPAQPLQATFIGHATFLVQAGGWNILTDPVFSKRASPVQWMGPARYTPPACTVGDLPPIHMVLLSHNHYDHLDAGTVAALLDKEKAALTAPPSLSSSGGGSTHPYTGTLWVVPLRVSANLQAMGVPVHHIVEMDWWDAFAPGTTGGGTGTCVSPHPSMPSSSPPSTPSSMTPPSETGGAQQDAATAAAGRHSRGQEEGAASGTYLIPHALRGTYVKGAAAPTPSPSSSSADGGGNAPPPPTTTRRMAGLSRHAPTVVCVPAQHQSARTPWDRNRTLWCGYALIAPTPDPTPASSSSSSNDGSSGGEGAALSEAATQPGPQPQCASSDSDVRLYFSGDTGYRSIPDTGAAAAVAPGSPEEDALPPCPAFGSIGRTVGPFHLALLPIGAYSPRGFMSSFHASPEDAVAMHADVASARSVGMHWGAFPLTDEPIEQPPERLRAAARRKGLPPDAFVAVWPGGTMAPGGPLKPEHVVAAPTPAYAEAAAAADKRPKGIWGLLSFL